MKNALANLRERLSMPRLAGNSRGMTLIEIIIVVALLATLMAILVTNITQRAESARADSTNIAMAKLAQGLQLYKVHNNKFPTTEQGLNALLVDPGGDSKRWRGPYIDPGEVKDGWNNDLAYESDGVTFKITATPPSGKPIVYPAEEGGKAEEPAK